MRSETPYRGKSIMNLLSHLSTELMLLRRLMFREWSCNPAQNFAVCWLVCEGPTRILPHSLTEFLGPNDISCSHGPLDGNQIDEANEDLDMQCGNGGYAPVDENGRDKYAIAGDTVAYFCNMAYNGNNCYASERRDATRRIRDICGPTWGGQDYA